MLQPKSGADQVHPAPHSPPRFEVGRSVADVDRSAEIDAQLSGRILEHAHARLATLAWPGEIGVVGAEIGTIDPRAGRAQLLLHPLLHGAILGFPVLPARDPRLVAG